MIANAGTTTYGSIDPVAILSEKQNVDYIHVDACFGGMVIPFFQQADWLNLVRVKSVALDLHKMAQQPYPSGLFLCKKGL